MRHPIRLVLLVVASLLFLSLDHGLPHRYLPDDTVVRCALGMAQDASEGQGLAGLVPPASKYTTYPYLLPYLDLGLLGGVYVGGRVAGLWSGPGEFKEAIFADATYAWLPARMLSALLALLVPYGVYRAARELSRSKGESALAALLAGSSLMLVQYAHTVRPWAPMLGFTALALALSLRLQRRRRVRDAVLAFAAAALAGSTFQVGLSSLALPVAGLLLGALSDRAAGRAVLAPLARHALAGLAAAALLLQLVGYPYRLVHGAQSGQGFQTGASALLEDGAPTLDLGGQAFEASLFGGARLAEAARSWLGYDPVLVGLGALGVLLLLVRERRAATLLFVVLPAGGFSALFLLYDGTHVRYLMTALPYLALSAALPLAALARGGAPARALALLLLALPLVQAVRLDVLLARDDTRTLAAHALPGVIPAAARVAVDGMGSQYGPPLVPSAAGLAAYLADAGARATGPAQHGLLWLNRTEQRVLDLAAAGVPEPEEARFLLPVLRYWKYDSYYPTDFLLGERPVALGEWMDALAVDTYVQVDRVPDAARRQPVTDLVAARGTLLWELSPTGETDPRVAELPTDLDFALLDLWRYERPGPWIRVWAIAGPAPP